MSLWLHVVQFPKLHATLKLLRFKCNVVPESKGAIDRRFKGEAECMEECRDSLGYLKHSNIFANA